jgi:hypothetical protein
LKEEEKNKIIDIGMRRANMGMSLAITQYGRPMDMRNVRRYTKQIARSAANLRFRKPGEHSIQVLPGLSLPFGNRMFATIWMYRMIIANLSSFLP